MSHRSLRPLAKTLLWSLLSVSLLVLPAAGHAGLIATDFGGTMYNVSVFDASMTYIGSNGLTMGALEYDGAGTLYGITAGASSLYTINPSTAAATSVGSLGLGAFEGGIAFAPTGEVYAVNGGTNVNPYLLSINIGTGVATDIAQIGAGNHDINGLAWRSDGMLIGLDDNTSSLVTINPVTGAVAALSYFDFSTSNVGGMTIIGNRGYFATGAGNDINGNPGTNALYVFDPFSGAYDQVGAFGPTSHSFGISGLAATPEPGSFLLGAVGLAGLLFIRKRLV